MFSCSLSEVGIPFVVDCPKSERDSKDCALPHNVGQVQIVKLQPHRDSHIAVHQINSDITSDARKTPRGVRRRWVPVFSSKPLSIWRAMTSANRTSARI